jgi:DNA-binding transcriptional MerR regulator
MIGSNTLVIKENNVFRVHVFGGWPGDFTFEELSTFESKHKKKPDARGLTDVDAYKILSSHQCNSEFEPNYSEFAGDALYLLDLDDKKVVTRQDFCKEWKIKNPTKLSEMKSVLELNRQEKMQQISKVYEQLEQDVLRLMEVRKQTKRTEDYDFNNPRCEYDESQGRVNFFVGHANQKIDGLEPFHKWFLKRRKNLKALVKRKGWNGEIDVEVYTFTHKNKKWFWSAWHEKNDIYEYIK